jgi:hypothetical protein
LSGQLPEPFEPVQDLLAKRAELADELERRLAALTRLSKQMDALDLVLGMFQAAQPEIVVFPQYRKEVARLVFAALRETGRPMTSIELADRVLVAKRVAPADRQTIAEIRKRVRSSLAHHRRKGVLQCRKSATGLNEWTIA